MAYSLNEQFSENFWAYEFFVTMQPGGRDRLWAEFLALPEDKKKRYWNNLKWVAKKLQFYVRDRYGRGVIITSGWRSIRVNQGVGGASLSRHLIGEAADFNVSGLSPGYIQKDLSPIWFGGLGYGKFFTHIDIRQYRARFSY